MTALQILAILVCVAPVALLLSIWFLALRELVRLHYAEERGRELTDSGRLVPVFHPTAKEIATC